MKKKLFTILTCVGLLLCLIPTNVNANVDTYSSGSINGRSYATTIHSGNTTFTAYTYSGNSGENVSLKTTANYRVGNTSSSKYYNIAEDASTGYAMLSKISLPNGASAWTIVSSKHYVNGTELYYSYDTES